MNLAIWFFCLAVAAEGIGMALWEIGKARKQKKNINEDGDVSE